MNQVEFRRARLHDSRVSDARLPTRGAAAGSASVVPVTETPTEIFGLVAYGYLDEMDRHVLRSLRSHSRHYAAAAQQ